MSRAYTQTSARPLFFYDLNSPYAYLASERIDLLLPQAAWVPVFAAGLFAATGRTSWALSNARSEGMREVERRAVERGLPPIRWPDPWPGNSLLAMRAAIYAQDNSAAGRSFAQAAFRLHFVEGLSLEHDENVARAADLCDIDPRAMLDACRRPEMKARLRKNTDSALELGVYGVPTFVVAGQVFWGDDQLEGASLCADSGPHRP